MKLFKTILLGTAAIMAIASITFLAGPRVDLDTRIEPLTLPLDLETYLAEQESIFTDLKPGTEKSILWANEEGQKSDYAIVYLHGFSASRQESAPLTELIASNLQANAFLTRFAGHGRSNEAMLDGSVNAWVNDSVEALEIGKRLGKKVIIVGVSTGATAATWLAQHRSEDIAAMVLISPNFAPKDSRSAILTWPWGGQLAELLIGPERSWQPINEEQSYFWTHQYPTKALLPMMGLVKLVNSGDMGAISTPTLMVYSQHDSVISTDAAEHAFERLGSSQKHKVIFNDAEDPSNHVLAGDILSPSATDTLVAMITQFVEQHTE